MSNGSIVEGLAQFYGNPTGVSTSRIDVTPGTIVVDTLSLNVYLKTSPLGDNSGYQLNSSRKDVVQAQNVLLGFGAVGDRVHDDTAAIQAALDTGENVFLPQCFGYKITAPLQFSSQAGQRMFGSAMEETLLAVTVNGVDAIRLGARSQRVEHMTISGTSQASGGNGIVIPFYYPYWRVDSVLIRNCNADIFNKTNNAVIGPGGGGYIPGYPGGSDAGGITGCQFTDSQIGILTFGNKDDVIVDTTSVGACLQYGLMVDGDGGLSMRGQVLGGNGTGAYVKDGNLSLQAVHLEADSSVPGFSGQSITLGGNARCDINNCFNEKNGDATVVDVYAPAGSQVDFYGVNGGFSKCLTQGDGQIRAWGGRPGQIIVSVNTVADIPAGPYDFANALPSPSKAYTGRHFALIADGTANFEEYVCEYIGGAYTWNPISNRRAYLTTSDPHVAGKLWNNLGIATFSGG